MSPAEKRAFALDDKRIYLWGELRYQDAFGEEWTTNLTVSHMDSLARRADATGIFLEELSEGDGDRPAQGGDRVSDVSLRSYGSPVVRDLRVR